MVAVRKISVTAPMRSNCANASTVRFCAASSTALRYAALRCRRMAVNWPDLKLECRSKIRSASPRATEACCPVSPDKMMRASRAQSNSRFMSSIPTAPASSNTINCRSDRTGLDSSRLCSVFASNPSLRKTSVAAAVGAQNSGSIFASLQAATNSRNAVVLPLPARPRRPVMRSLVRRTW